MSQSRLIFVLVILCSGCSQAESPGRSSLTDLVGLSPSQKQETLRRGCLFEAERVEGRIYAWQQRPHGEVPPQYSPWVYQMKDLCWRMVATYSSPPSEERAGLALQCNDLVNKAVHKDDPDSANHASTMRQICSLLTNPPEELGDPRILKRGFK